MKIVVMWEDPDEESAAQALVNVLPKIAPSLVRAQVDANGGVSIRSGGSQTPIRVRARCCPADDEARMFGYGLGVVEWGGGLVRLTQVPPAVIGRADPPKPKPQPPKPQPPRETRDLIFPEDDNGV